jgi:dephospho-CoA kinase
MKIIGITGGIGSGKTTVCLLFESMGIPVYYADIQAKKIMNSNPTLKKKVKDLLGDEAYFANGKLNRVYVASKIFSDKEMLSQINQLVHPMVQEDSKRWSEQFRKDEIPYVIKEAALLVENGSYRSLDSLIVVTCPQETRIQRVIKRDKTTYEAVLKKLKIQLPEDEKIKVADFVIDNSGHQSLIPQVWKIHKKLIKSK